METGHSSAGFKFRSRTISNGSTSDLAIWRHSRIALLLESTQTVEDTILTVALLFAQFFGASSDSLEHFFHLTLLVGRDFLKCTSDESGVLAEDRNEDPGPLHSQRNGANAATG